MSQHQPPKLARKIFEWYCGAAKVEDLLGDMDEWFLLTAKNKGLSSAKIKYWKQVLQLIFSYAIRKRKKQSQISGFAQNGYSLGMLKNYFVVASRNLYRHKYFTIVNAVGLAIGMSMSLLLITMMAYIYTFDNFHNNKDRIYRVIASHEKSGQVFNMASAPSLLADKLKQDVGGIEKISRIASNFRGEVSIDGNGIPLHGYYTDPAYLQMFSFELMQGEKSSALEKVNSIVLTESTAKKLFGDEPAFGNVIEFAKKGTFEITGILKDPPKNTHFDFEFLASYSSLPMADNAAINYSSPFSYGLEFVYLMVRSDYDIKNIEPYLAKISSEASKNSDAQIIYSLQSLNDITPGPDLAMLTGGLGPQWEMTGFYMFAIICLLILLPACFNYTNISIARAIKRAKEIGLRKTMGGSSHQIFLQFITETVVVTVISLLGALLLFILVRTEFQKMMVAGSSLDLSLNWKNASLFIAFAIITGVIAGVTPAFYFTRLNPVQALKNNSIGKGLSGMWIRKSLTVFQFILSFGFIVTLIVFARQYRYSMNYNFGFQRENILDVNLQGTDPNLFVSEYNKLSTVRDISFSSDVMGLHHNSGDSWVQFEAASDSTLISDMYVDTHFITNLGLQLLAGTNFPNEPWSREQHIIVNEEFLKTFRVESPADAIGKVVRINKEDLHIIGVLKNFHYTSLREPIKTFALRYNPTQFQFANLKVSFTDAYSEMSEMEKLWKKMGNTSSLQARFMQDEINGAYEFYYTFFKIVAFLGILAISISLLGMLGMVVYTSEQRTKEVGIRKVLGATAGGITYLLSKDYLKLMAWAFVVAIPLSIFILDWMLSSIQHYSVQLTIWDILAAIIIIVGLGLLTISSQTIKTASTNPADTLRSE